MEVQCPSCGLHFNAKRHSHGAGYALKMKRLSQKRHLALLAWWFSTPILRDKPLTKESMVNGFKYIDQDGINGRISELKAWRLVNEVGRGEYVLDKERVKIILNAEGNLDVLRALDAKPVSEHLSELPKSSITAAPTDNKKTLDELFWNAPS